MGKRSLNLQSVARLMTSAASFGVLAAVLMAALAATPVHAQIPVVPQAFYGTIEIDGQPAPAGAAVEARGTNVKTGIAGNPITTTEAGKYGGPLLSNVKLIVQGNIDNGSAIEFYINGVKAECASPEGSWQSSFPFRSEDVTVLNLRVGQGPTVTSTPTSTSAAIRISPTPRATSTATPRPVRTPAPGSSATPESIAATATEATGTTAATATPEAAQQVLPSSTPNAAGDAASTPSPTLVVLSGETPRAVSTAPTATQLASPASATPAGVALALTPTTPKAPQPTSKPILAPGGQMTAGPESGLPTPTPGVPGGVSGGMLVPLLGVGALLAAGIIGAVILLRRRIG